MDEGLFGFRKEDHEIVLGLKRRVEDYHEHARGNVKRISARLRKSEAEVKNASRECQRQEELTANEKRERVALVAAATSQPQYQLASEMGEIRQQHLVEEKAMKQELANEYHQTLAKP